MIPLVDLHAQHSSLRREILQAISHCIDSSALVGGPDCSAFAEEFADFCGGGHVALCGSGTDALYLAIRVLIGSGDGSDEIITVANTFCATAEGIVNAGYRPVFVDVDPATLLMDMHQLRNAINPRTKAIVPVHLYGQMVDMRSLTEVTKVHGIPVIEDAAQAHGASWEGLGPGHWSEAACFSFYVSKNLGALGEGGAVFSRDRALTDRITRIANHGATSKYVHEDVGLNSRLDGLQAAVLRVKLRHLPEWNRRRRELAGRYDRLLGRIASVEPPQVSPGAEHVFHLYVVQVPDRDAILRYLQAAGVQAGVHYPIPLHEQNAYRTFRSARDGLPITTAAASRILSLPIYPEMTDQQAEAVCETLEAALAAVRRPTGRPVGVAALRAKQVS
jgi:dTDP-4-amino-4,6-dideoxygalactose transaminase